VTPKQPFDDEPTLTDGKVIDGEIVDGEVIEDLDTQVIQGDDLTARLREMSLGIDEPPAELGEERTATLHALAAAAGNPPVDLGDSVVAQAGRARRRRYVITATAAVLALALSGTAVAARNWGDDSTDRLVSAAPQSAEPSTGADGTPSVLPSGATSSRSAAPTPLAGTDTAVDAVAGVGPLPDQAGNGSGAGSGSGSGAGAGSGSGSGGTPSTPPSPRPTQGPPAAPLQVQLSPAGTVTTRVGQKVVFVMTWNDGDGRLRGTSADWGDATPGTGGAAEERCSQVPLAGSGEEKLSHTWNNPGRYTVLLTLSTVNCQGVVEEREFQVTVNVLTQNGQAASATPSSGA
jgi:hypothetical protein